MFEFLSRLPAGLRKSRDDLVRLCRNRGLREAARAARWVLDAPQPDDGWSVRECRTLRALLERMCAYGSDLPPPPETDALDSAVEFVRTLPDGRRRQLRDLLVLVEAGSIVLGPDGQYRPFTDLDPEAADAYLRSWDESPFPPQRAAFRALKSICMMGYWSQPETWEPIGYSLEDNPGLETSSNSS